MQKMIQFILLTALISLTTACVETERQSGYVQRGADVASLKPGQSTKDDVKSALGSPSTTSNFGEETWYYIGQTMLATPLFAPKIQSQQAMVLTFNKEGILQDMRQDDGKERRELSIVDDKTPTSGHKVGVMEQFLGNLGRFNAPADGQ